MPVLWAGFLLIFMLFTSVKSTQAAVIQSETAETVCESPYLVSPGETLNGIAFRCRLTPFALLRLNPTITDPDHIYPGQRLILFKDSSTSHSDTDVPVPVTGEKTYTVRSGDTLGLISRRVGLTVSQVMLANPGILDPNRIFTGQKLILPDPGSIPSDANWRSERIASSLDIQQGRGTGYQPKRPDERWIYVDLATQTVHAYEGDTIARSFIGSTGKANTPTVTGTFRIWVKLRYDDMRGPGYFLEDVPYVMYFYRGYGLHGTTWHNNFGSPMSAGCVNLSVQDAAWLYDFAKVGTVIRVQ